MSRGRSTSFQGQWAGRLVELLESPAYRTLSLSAQRVINRVEIEAAHHGGKENGRLPVTYDDFERYGVHRHAIAPAIREAVALGFLEITEVGRAGNSEYRSSNKFRLTFRPAKGSYGNDGTHEWRKIPDMVTAKAIADGARKWKPEKTKSQCRKTPDFTPAKRTMNGAFHSTESTTTGHGTETALLSISRAGGRNVAKQRP